MQTLIHVNLVVTVQEQCLLLVFWILYVKNPTQVDHCVIISFDCILLILLLFICKFHFIALCFWHKLYPSQFDNLLAEVKVLQFEEKEQNIFQILSNEIMTFKRNPQIKFWLHPHIPTIKNCFNVSVSF